MKNSSHADNNKFGVSSWTAKLPLALGGLGPPKFKKCRKIKKKKRKKVI
jgi:hypothetical protein